MDALLKEIADQQVENHVKYANIRAGINHAGTDRQIDRAARHRAEWSARPPRNQQRPRSSRFVYPPKGLSPEDAAGFMEERVLYNAGGTRVRMGGREIRAGTQVVNQAARHLFDLVSYGGGFLGERKLGRGKTSEGEGFWACELTCWWVVFLGLSLLQDAWLGWGGYRGAALFGGREPEWKEGRCEDGA